MKPNSSYRSALYMRLSKDDNDAFGIPHSHHLESSSITTQRQMLLSYAKEHGFEIFDLYIDDGYKGTNFQRPAFKRMLRDIEAKRVNLVITKDLSRLGRDYIQTGQYTELYFPSKGVRYIAINDGYDSDSPYTDIAPFVHVVNEMMARDISKKIKSSIRTRMEQGYYIGNFAPYGYQKDPSDKHHLIPDTEVALVVSNIFKLAAQGNSAAEIAAFLNQEQLLAPLAYRKAKLSVQSPKEAFQSPIPSYAAWTANTVSKLLRNIVYLGHMAQGKSVKVSFKNTISISKPRDEWIIVEHTHEPLVNQVTFDAAAKRHQTYRRTHHSKPNLAESYSLCCGCCGQPMTMVHTRRKDGTPNLTCSRYKRLGRTACSNHFIHYGHLSAVISNILLQMPELHSRDIARICIGQGYYEKTAHGNVKHQAITIILD